MPKSTITSKGQITLPKAVREALNVSSGDQVAFTIGSDGTVTVAAASLDLRELKGSVRSHVRGVSLQDMRSAIRKSASRL